MSTSKSSIPSAALQLTPNLGNEMITLQVGPSRTEFIIHKTLACNSVDFLKSAFHGAFSEAEQGVLHLPEDDPETISLFINWIYRRSFPTGHTVAHLHKLFNLYVFADKICLPDLKDATMDTVQDMARVFDLKDVCFTAELYAKVRHTKLRGLKYFCLMLMSDTYLNRGHEDPDALDDGHLDGFAVEDLETDIDDEIVGFTRVWIRRSDLKAAWEIIKDDFDFLVRFQRLLSQGFEHSADPRYRDESFPKDRCYFHCHDKHYDCRRATKAESTVFVLNLK